MSPSHSGPLLCCSSHVRLITSCLPTSTLYLRTVSHICVSSMVSSGGSCAETAVTLAGGQARGEQSKSVAHHTCMSLRECPRAPRIAPASADSELAFSHHRSFTNERT
jgi:hypothetical protein